jgi:hypothetical protein
MHMISLSNFLLLSHFRSSLNYPRKAKATGSCTFLQMKVDEPTQPLATNMGEE